MWQHLFKQGSGRFARFPLVERLVVRAGGRISSRLAVLAGLLLTFGQTPGLFGQTSGVLTNLAQVNAVSLTDAAKGIPVRVRATVTYMDPDWRMMFVQDDTGAIYVGRNAPAGDASWNLQPGEVVDLTGITSPGIAQSNIKELKLNAVGPGPLPKPELLGSAESFKHAGDARWVKATGVITGVRTLEKKLDLDLQLDPNRSLRLIVVQGSPVNAATFLGSMVDVTGVMGIDTDANRKPTGRNDIWINDLAGIRATRALPVTPISDLKVDAQRLPMPLRRVQGRVVSQNPGEFVVIRDDSGSVRVNCRTTESYRVGSPVEVFGYVDLAGGVLVLTEATVRVPNIPLAEQGAGLATPIPLAADQSLPELRKISQIRNLSAGEAARGYPVKVRGVLTFVDAQNAIVFVQDDSGGIFVDSTRKRFESFPEASQLVEITGFTGPGDYAPVIEAEHLQELGGATLPAPKSATMQVLMTGVEDSQWVSLNGVVRSQMVVEDSIRLSLATGDSVITAEVPNASRHPAPRNYVDAWVEVRGVCTTVFDNHRHLQGITLSVPDWNAVRTWDVGADDPFVLAVRPLDQLLEFHAGGEGLHREHVRGTVLLGRADGSFYLQDATGGILIQAQAATGLINVGRTLDVVGFPSIVNKWPVLQEAMVRGGDKKSDLTPAFLPPESLLNQARHGTLVRLQARVIGRVTDAKEELLELQAGPWIAEAMLEKDQAVEKLGGIEAGSTVELTGVYQARLDDNLNIQSFQILLRSPADVRVLARPNWWTARRVIWSVATLGMAFALVLGWVTLLRTQVNARTRELRVEIEERKRMEAQVARTHKELLEVSRSAGMAEVASNVLHNVGNVLNSVNVSASLVVDRTRQSKVTELGKVAALLDQHAADLPGFLAADPTGAELRGYLHQLNQHLAREQQTAIAELMSLHKNIEHIKDIVARQQSYAKISGVTETIAAAELVEDALRMNAGATRQGTIQVVREYADVPPITVEKHKVLQILVNLIRNAEHACNDSGRPDQQLRLRISPTAKGVAIAVTDNGVGVPAENLTRIFGHGFTTRKGGHGFGLHGGALAARELGGSLTARSDGPGTGATFVLELALAPKPG